MNEKKELSMSERISWALGQATGRQFITALVSTYILIDRCIIFSGFHSAGSFFLCGKHPLHLGIFPQSRQHFITDIDFNRDQTSLISFIRAGHSHLKISSIGIRIDLACI